jgi:hypothetical protein
MAMEIMNHYVMMETETASVTLECSSIMTRLVASEDFIVIRSCLLVAVCGPHVVVHCAAVHRVSNFVADGAS